MPTKKELEAGDYEWDFPKEHTFRKEYKSSYIKEGNTKPLRHRDMTIVGMGLRPKSFTANGMAQADAIVIRKLAGKDPS